MGEQKESSNSQKRTRNIAFCGCQTSTGTLISEYGKPRFAQARNGACGRLQPKERLVDGLSEGGSGGSSNFIHRTVPPGIRLVVRLGPIAVASR